jgi:DNA repair exonuclease SbcCD ATPase subunit
MRLLSLTVRNYRIHRDITVEFDPSRNLIGGTNETGKSTLAEAIHRALFMRHRAGGDLQKAMVSDIHPGAPEVKLTFQAGGETWTVEKQFAGTKGSARLRSESGMSLQGDAAEDKLSEIIANPDGMANRLNELTTRWSHLWVWQGTAGSDASTHAASRRDELVQRLQQQGLAAVMQSETDERARGKIRLAYDDIFTRTGTVKANSRLDLATKSLTEANTVLTRAIEQKQRLESAVIEQENASKILAESIAALPSKREELATVNASLVKANELRARHEKEELILQTAATVREQIAKADQQIRDLRRQATAAREALVPAEAKLAVLTDQESKAREAASTAELAHRSISDAVRLTRQHHDLAAVCVSRFDKSVTHEALTAKVKEVAAIDESLASARDALAKQAVITPTQLESLRKLDTRIGQAESALAAIAAGIELISSDQAVLLDGQPLETGKPCIITEAVGLAFGSGTLLRIQPGGGTSLAESRRSLEDLRNKLTTALDQLAIKDVTEAAEIVANRQAIEQRISNIESQLHALGARQLPEALVSATDALNTAIAEVDHRRAALPTDQTPLLPVSLEAARAWQTVTRNALQNAETQEQALLADADARRCAHQEKLTALQSQRESLESGRRNLENLENSARTLEKNHGDPTTRAAALAAAIDAETAAKTALDTTNAALADLNPELLNQQVTRLTRVIANEEEKQRDAQTRIAVARATLALDGSADPEAELLQAKASKAAATESHARKKRHADAIALLHRLFSESQSAISESVTQPIADRVAGYLECVFGRGVRVGVDLTNPAQASIQLTRPGTPTFSFDSLSGGAKEQVAAALRLATAEILAANHDGCLPILFDDAFAYADDDRIQSLQTMLDLAANRGLQVLVLTCTPADYIGLGARETRLTPHLWSSTPSLPNNPAAADPDDSNAPTYATVPTPPSGDAETTFLDALRTQGGSAGNLTLRTTLGWDETTYDQVKTSLIDRNLITPGRGRGGSVSLADSI